MQQQHEFQMPNPGLTYDFQLVNVEDFNGVGETEPNPYFYQVRTGNTTTGLVRQADPKLEFCLPPGLGQRLTHSLKSVCASICVSLVKYVIVSACL